MPGIRGLAGVLGMLVSLQVQALCDEVNFDPKMEADCMEGIVRGQLGGDQQIKERLVDPLVADVPMRDLGGTAFGGQIQCPSTDNMLEVFVQPGSSGDIVSMRVNRDTDFDGTLDQALSMPAAVSGICANGVIACDLGSWDNCQYYRWNVTGANPDVLVLEPVQVTDLGGCYCVNNSCGVNLVWNNLGGVLGDIGGGAVGALMEADARYAVSESQLNGTVLTFKGQGYTGCGQAAGVSQQRYLGNTAAMLSDTQLTVSAETNEVYVAVSGSPAATTIGGTLNDCSVQRTVSLAEFSLDNLTDFCPAETVVWSNEYSLTNSATGLNVWVECGPGPNELTIFMDNDVPGNVCPVQVSSKTVPANIATGGGAFNDIRTTRTFDSCGPDGCQCVLDQNEVDYLCVEDNAQYPTQTACEAGCGQVTFCSSDNWYYVSQESSAQGCSLTGTCNYHLDTNYRVPNGSDSRGNLPISFVPVDPASTCALGSETINDACEGLAADPLCTIVSETRDGVRTIANGVSTGLSPTASPVNLVGTYCSLDVTRDWWRSDQTWVCQSADPPYDFTDALIRSEIAATETTLSSYQNAERVDGSWVYTTEGLVLPELREPEACEMGCKARRAVSPSTDSSGGYVVNTLKSEPVRYGYSYYRCVGGGQCPLQAGEELVEDCRCLNDFGEALSMMQAARLAAQDVICTSGTPQPLQ